MAKEIDPPSFLQIRRGTLIERLWREVGDTGREFANSPAGFLRATFLPDQLQQWFPVRLGNKAKEAGAMALRHPLRFLSEAFAPNSLEQSASPIFRKVMLVSGLLHSVLIGFLLYVIYISVFTNLRVVDREYRKLNTDEILKPLRYPPEVIRAYWAQKARPLDEVIENDKRRREAEKLKREKEERDRLKREEAERKRAEKELAEREKREAEQKVAEQLAKQKEEESKKTSETKIGELNIAPMRDIVGEIYKLYEKGELDLNEIKFSVGVAFKIAPDGSIPRSSLKLHKTSGSKLIDKQALEILWRLGESHILGQLATLSSPYIELTIDDDTMRLSLYGFAITPEEGAKLSGSLNTLFKLAAFTQKNSSPEVAELLSLVKVRADGKRVTANLAIGRARVTAMMHANFGNK